MVTTENSNKPKLQNKYKVNKNLFLQTESRDSNSSTISTTTSDIPEYHDESSSQKNYHLK